MIAHASEFGSCASSWIGSTAGTPVRHGSSHVQSGWGVVFHRPTLLWEGTHLLEGPAPCKALLIGVLTLGASRGAVMWRLDCLTVPGRILALLGDKAAKSEIGWVLAPYHASRDCRVRWEHGRRIKCPGSHTRDRWRTASLCSRPVDSPKPLPYLTVVVSSSPCWFARPIFRVQGYGRHHVLVTTRVKQGRRVRGLDFVVGSPCYGRRLGTPYWHPRH